MKSDIAITKRYENIENRKKELIYMSNYMALVIQREKKPVLKSAG